MRPTALSVGLPVLVGLLLTLSACGSGGGGGGGDGDGGTTYNLPDYTVAVQDSAAPVVNTDGSHYFADHTHIQLAEAIAGTTTTVRMTVTGVFNASRVYPILFAASLVSPDGWVLKFDRGFATSTSLQFQACVDEACSNSPPLEQFTNSYSMGSAFTLTVEVDCSGSPDLVRAWADSAYPATEDFSYNTGNAVGSLLGMSIHGATIRSIQVVQN